MMMLLFVVIMYKRYYPNILRLSNDVETNPGPTYRTCASCNKSVHIRKKYVTVALSLIKNMRNLKLVMTFLKITRKDIA
jgi:hypothetical protein